MKPSKGTYRIRVPASAANLGPGLDTLALALSLHLEVAIKISKKFKIEVAGIGQEQIPTTKEANLVYKAFSALCQKMKDKTPELEILIQNDIPPARGIGSSASGIVAGLLAANSIMGYKLNRSDLLQTAAQVEGHADNPAASLFGGCVVVTRENDRIFWGRVSTPPQLKVVLFIPDFEIPTQKARKILPKNVPLEDAVFNVQRAALLVSSLAESDFEMLKLSTKDRLHEDTRVKAFYPRVYDLAYAAKDAGAKGEFLCGSGSSIGAFAVEKPDYIANIMEEKAAEIGIAGTTTIVSPDTVGAVVEEID
ncbi:MAG: homoserine kinase [Candidatus Woykebacteria bacterium]